MVRLDCRVQCFFVLIIFFISFAAAGYTGKVMTGDVGAEIDPGIVVNDSSFRLSGSSTQFLYLNDVELENISGMVLEISYEGKITYIENINLTIDAVNNYVPLSENVEISHNYIFVNSTAMSSLNTSALITLYGLTFIQPKILKNGVSCGTSCSIISYIDGDLIFSVDSFSEYTAVEGYVAPEPDDNDGDSSSGGGGGGGGGEISQEIDDVDQITQEEAVEMGYDFNISEEFMDINLKSGKYFSKSVIVENNGTRDLKIALTFDEISSYVFVRDRIFELAPGEKKTVVLDFYFSKGIHPDVYFGVVNFNSMYVKRSANLVLNLNTDSLFDVRVEVLKDVITPYENPKATIELTNLGEGSVEVDVTYAIMDVNQNVLKTNTIKGVVNGTSVLEKTLNFPNRADGGDYLFYVRVDYGSAYAFSSDSFYVMDNSLKAFFRYVGEEGLVALFMVLMMIGAMIGGVLYYRSFKRRESLRKKSK